MLPARSHLAGAAYQRRALSGHDAVKQLCSALPELICCEHRMTCWTARQPCVPVRSKSAAVFKKKVDACRASATCNLEETCIGHNGFGAQQAKAQDLVEVRLNPTLTLLLQTLRDLLHANGPRNLSATRPTAAAACTQSAKLRALLFMWSFSHCHHGPRPRDSLGTWPQRFPPTERYRHQDSPPSEPYPELAGAG